MDEKISNKKDKDPTFITQETVKRLIKDVRDIRKNPLESNGIYYKHDDENILKGYALIIGPEGTPYEHGFYFFEIEYPYDYPYKPPKISFKTNQDRIRFNPNLYTAGKVCLSLLNTWRGEQWTSCQTISSILLTVCTVFNEQPLLNEPGVGRGHRDFLAYNEIIEYANIKIAILNIVNKNPGIYIPMFDHFYDIVMENFTKNKDNIRNKIEHLVRNNIPHPVSTSLYSMSVMIDYDKLIEYFDISHQNIFGKPKKKKKVVIKMKKSSSET